MMLILVQRTAEVAEQKKEVFSAVSAAPREFKVFRLWLRLAALWLRAFAPLRSYSSRY